jgi:hypothetical protein
MKQLRLRTEVFQAIARAFDLMVLALNCTVDLLVWRIPLLLSKSECPNFINKTVWENRAESREMPAVC